MRPEIAVLDIQGQYRVYRSSIARTLRKDHHPGQRLHGHHGILRPNREKPAPHSMWFVRPACAGLQIHNRHEQMLTKEVEGQILLELIDHFAAEHVLSFSWGGAATLVALAHRPRRVERAVISSFSPVINAPMRDYLERGVDYLGNSTAIGVGHLVNSTIGKHLPSLFKRFNYKHVSSLAEHEYGQMHFHISQVLNSDRLCYLKAAKAIDIRCCC